MGLLMESTEVKLGTASYRSRRPELELFGAMGTPSDYFTETVHTIAINTRETEFGSLNLVEPIPITLKTYKQFQAHGLNGYRYTAPPPVAPVASFAPIAPIAYPVFASPVKEEPKDDQKITRPPPKKKWIKEYLEEEPKSPVPARVVPGLAAARGNGLVRPPSPPAPAPDAPAPAPAPHPPALLLDFVQEHSRPRAANIHGGQIPSPPSVGSNGSASSGSGSAPRAGTREVHNKLEKNRRAHLKECFELLKRQLPATTDDKKTSNLSILGSAIRYIQVLRRKERECEHEMERLAREKIAAQQRLAALKRDVPPRPARRSPPAAALANDAEENVIEDHNMNGQVLGIPVSLSPSLPGSPPRSLNLSTKLRALPIQLASTTSQVVRTSYGTRHNTLTLTTLASADTANQNGQTVDAGALGAALVHPAHLHLPLSQVVGGVGVGVGGGLVVVPGGLRVLHHHLHNGVTSGENNRIAKENGIVSPPPVTTANGGSSAGVVVSPVPLVVSTPSAALLHTHTLAHKMVETQVVKGSIAPLTVSAQYLSATTIVKPVVVVSAAAAGAAPAPPQPANST